MVGTLTAEFEFPQLVDEDLGMLLGAAMKQADVRIDPLHHLAVEFKHEARDAMRGRMLGSKLIVKLRSEGSCPDDYTGSSSILEPTIK